MFDKGFKIWQILLLPVSSFIVILPFDYIADSDEKVPLIIQNLIIERRYKR